ncbi:hypothetical protein FJZ18_01085 [Candidatus Pacearchaeota archaeon]|nr:hypothetical protein [Candidatus Pacearchaeota archaeon]
MARNRKTKVIKILLALLFFTVLLAVFLSSNKSAPTLDSCEKDSDCVPSSCCHPASCVLKNQAPECKGVICSQECKPGTLDCGQASCSCQNKRCVVKRQ